VPVKGEIFLWNDLRFEVMHTTAGVVKWFKVRPINIRPKSLESTLSSAPVLDNSKTL
jgi:hypothetical protein